MKIVSNNSQFNEFFNYLYKSLQFGKLWKNMIVNNFDKKNLRLKDCRQKNLVEFLSIICRLFLISFQVISKLNMRVLFRVLQTKS